MSESLTVTPGASGDAVADTDARESRQPSLVTRYGAALLFVAAATGCGFILEPLIGAPNLTLVFVLPVLAAATGFGWGPSLVATLASVVAFDFFFTEPRFSLAIASSSDICAAALLLVIAASVSTIAAQSRRRELAARWAAEQAQALQVLAHAVIESAPRSEVFAAAAVALHRIFRAPSVIFMQQGDALRLVARAGGAVITSAEEEAAKGVLDAGLHARADTYPYDRSTFDFWPSETPGCAPCVVGVSFLKAGRARPAELEPLIEIVSAYVASALKHR
jgi:K+-sensing histidine kinase KdpD